MRQRQSGSLRITSLREAFERSAKPTAAVAIALLEGQLAAGDRPGAIETYRRFRQIDPHAAGSDVRLRTAYERALWSAPQALPTNVPAAKHRLLGRDAELAAALRALDSERLVVLLGPGGIGKTRLAIELAQRMLSGHRDGVWWIDLTAARSVQDVCAAASRALSRREPAYSFEQLVLELRDRCCVLVLDCCDAVAELAGELGVRLRDGCRGVGVLATSQRPLRHVPVIDIPPLSLPQAGATSRMAALSSDAVRLFVERAVEANPGFVLTDDNAADVAEVCRFACGSAFAIEGAAAYVAHLDVHQLVERLRELRPHSVLLAAQRSVEWAYGMLPAPEAALLRRASILAAGWSIDAADAVFGDDAGAALANLVRASLVVAGEQRNGLTRYRLLDATRSYAHERLQREGELEATRTRWLEWLLRVVRTSESLTPFAEQIAPALEIGCESREQRTRALHLCAALELKLATLESPFEMLSRVAGLVELVRREEEPSDAFIDALGTYARLGNFFGDHELGRKLHRERIALARQQGNRALLARALAGALPALLNAGLHDEARAVGTEALEVARAAGEIQICADALRGLSGLAHFEGKIDEALRYCDEFMALLQHRISKGTIGRMLIGYFANAQKLGDFARGRAALERALALAHEIGDYGMAAHCEMSLGFCALHDRRIAEAHEALQRAVALSQHGSNTMTQLDALEELAAASIRNDQLDGVASVLGYVDACRMRLHLRLNPYVAGRSERLRRVAHAMLGGSAYARAHAAGERFTLNEALAAASRLRCGAATLEESDRFSRLSRREREVAVLVARGKKNREIAQELGLSVRTVDAHVASILDKLGIERREEIGAYAEN
jgi:predicted ATPase/DNA-binding CsgD family transcriptional regulator